ncbi:hypothetical protein LCGC14_0945270 [marine sediment metagenome]|uniref:Polysaccharide pyruvyl transferase domain-containing protein n=1 Tax=marine sediment metagenome TaxID=412755 RepID=A0A0F9R2F7_9ZZZZ
MKSKNILLTGGALSQNHGAEAMTIASIQIIKDVLPQSNIFITSKIDEDRKYARNHNVEFIEYPRSILGRLKIVLVGFICAFLHLKPKNEFLSGIYKSDLIIDITGDSFGDYKSLNVLSIGLRQLPIIFFNKPLIIFPQSLGPFIHFFSKIMARIIFNYSKVIFIRERISLNYIRTFLNNPQNIFFCIDTAFFLEENTEETNYDKFYEKNNESLLIIGIAASQLISSEKYIEIFSNLSNQIINSYGHKILLIPHVIDTIAYKNDDRIVLKKIYQNIHRKEKCLIIEEDLPAPILKKLIGMCDIFIGSRMHSNIAAISSNVPTIAISNSHKFLGIMELYEQGEYVLNVNNLDFNNLINCFNKICDLKDKIKEKLKYFNSKYQKQYRELLQKSLKLFLRK